MVHYGCAKTDSGGVECFVEFSEKPRCYDTIPFVFLCNGDESQGNGK